jgi:hypothetical protein
VKVRLLTIWAFYWEKFTAENNKTSLKNQSNTQRNNACKENLEMRVVKFWNVSTIKILMSRMRKTGAEEFTHHGSFIK